MRDDKLTKKMHDILFAAAGEAQALNHEYIGTSVKTGQFLLSSRRQVHELYCGVMQASLTLAQRAVLMCLCDAGFPRLAPFAHS